MNNFILDNYHDGPTPNCQYYDKNSLDALFNDNSENKLKIFHLNIRSVSKHLDEFLLNTNNLDLSVIVLTETWLNHSSEWVNIPGFTAYHNIRKDKKGGGVSILVNNFLTSSLQENMSISNEYFQSICVEITAANSKCNVLGVYKPPSSSIASFNDTFFPLLSYFTVQNKCIITGDFNINTLKDNPCLAESNFIDSFIVDSYLPLINLPTRVIKNETNEISTCIDHIYINSHDDFISGVIDLGISDHYSIFCIIPFTDRLYDKKQFEYRETSEQNIELLKRELMVSINIFKNFDDFNINDRFKIFSNILHDTYFKCCPIKKKTLSYKRLTHPWITDNLKRCLDEKHRLRRISYSNPDFKAIFKAYSNTLNDTIMKAKREFFRAKFDSIKNDSKKTWKYINSLLKNKSKNETIELKENESMISDPIKVAQKFNDYFSKIASDLDKSIPLSIDDPLQFIPNHNHSFFFAPCTSHEIETCIKSFKSKQSPLNQIPNFIFKSISDIIAPTLCELINSSVISGIFPSCLKISKVTPIHKKGTKYSVENYRPISTQPFISKIYERIIHNRIVKYCCKFNIIYPEQFGFQKNKSTTDAILLFTDQCYQTLEQKNFLASIYLDFSKAFDTVNHKILVSKLEKYGIRGEMNKWFEDYLTNRQQFVDIKGNKSCYAEVKYGVPQGSILGPLLFLLYINDMHNSTNMKLILFADDSTAIARNSDIVRLKDEINIELNKIQNWLCTNRLSLNISKSMFSIFSNFQNFDKPQITIANEEISYSKSTKYLGMIIDDKLNFSNHIRSVCNKIRSRIGILKKLSATVPKTILRNLYFSLIYPHITRDIEIWGNSSSNDIRRLRALVDKCIKLIKGPNNQTENTNFTLKLMKFDEIYTYFCLIRFYKYYKMELSDVFVARASALEIQHGYATRSASNQNINLPQFRLSKTNKSFFKNAIKRWNDLPLGIKNLDKLQTFKKQLKLLLLSKYLQHTS